MKSFAFLFLILTLMISCNQTRNSPVQEIRHISTYDSVENKRVAELDSSGLLKPFNFNDTAKWLIYLRHYQDSTRWGDTKKAFQSVPLSYLPLRLNIFSLSGDTLDLMYMFWYNDTTFVENFAERKRVTRGVRFEISKRKFLGFWGDETITAPMNDGSISKGLITTDFIQFCKRNRAKLDPWLRTEVSRRGYL